LYPVGIYRAMAINNRAGLVSLLRLSFREMKNNDPLRLAGATAFFTSFALPPILIILFQLFSLFVNRRFVGSEMMQVLKDTFGEEGANQIRVTARGFRNIATNWYTATGGFLFLVFVATTLFMVIKNSLNDIWKIRVKERPGFTFYLKTRGRSMLVILLAGILFLASLFLDGLQVLTGHYLEKLLYGGSDFLMLLIGKITGVIVVAAWFILLFRYLADAHPSWKVAILGGCLTGVLFTLGKALLSYLIIRSNVNSIYGTSGSLVLLLLFVFYSSFILYYGASFIKVYAEIKGKPLTPDAHAYQYELQELK
jgi:membrane protein